MKKSKVRSVLVLIVLSLCVAFFQGHYDFKGLTSRAGIEQAQVAREFSRGNGLTSKVVRPIVLNQLQASKKQVDIYKIPETYHAPLNMICEGLIFKLINKVIQPELLEIKKYGQVYILDKIVNIYAMSCFILAVLLSYWLIRHIFDHGIAFSTSLILLLSQPFWNLTKTGLPQMLMLVLLTMTLLLIWKSIQLQEKGKKPYLHLGLATLCFIGLAFTHWLTIWIFIGFFIFAAFYFKPKGYLGALLFFIMLIPLVFVVISNESKIGEGLGTAFYALNGGQGDRLDYSLREFGPVTIFTKGMVFRIIRMTLLQFSQIQYFLGGLILAPAFLFSLFYTFRKSAIGSFRWCLFSMWFLASIGMSVFGLKKEWEHTNQLHVLFVPIMTAYGIALLSILWSKFKHAHRNGLIQIAPIIVVVAISCAPMFVTVLSRLFEREPRVAMLSESFVLQKNFKRFTGSKDIIVSNQPWSVAWYSDRYSIWLPNSYKQFNAMAKHIRKYEFEIEGVHLGTGAYTSVKNLMTKSNDFFDLLVFPWLVELTNNDDLRVLKREIAKKVLTGEDGFYFRYVKILLLSNEGSMIYYSKRPTK